MWAAIWPAMRWVALGVLGVSVAACACGGQARPAQEDLLQVMTYNIRWPAPTDGANHWRHRREGLARYLAAAAPQLTALQEVADAQLAYLEADGEPARWAPPANVLLKSARAVTWVRTASVALPGGEYPRAAVLATFEWRGRRGTFVSAHLSGGPAGFAQASLLLDVLSTWPRPWIVAGDFNAFAQPDAECRETPARYHGLCNGVADLLRAAGLVDVWVEVHGGALGATGTGFQRQDERWHPDFDARIDWIMATPDVVPVEVQIDDPETEAGRPLSDHRPVRAWFEWSRGFGGAQ
jgi:endonuclease/exonuclease/phosphatase family metal-dependent hydrolase